MFCRKTTALWDSKSNIYLIISCSIFFFLTTLCTYSTFLLWKCVFMPHGNQPSHFKCKTKFWNELKFFCSHTGRWKWVVCPLYFIYSRHSDIVIKQLYQHSFRQIRFLIYSQDDTVRSTYTQLAVCGGVLRQSSAGNVWRLLPLYIYRGSKQHIKHTINLTSSEAIRNLITKSACAETPQLFLHQAETVCVSSVKLSSRCFIVTQFI